MNTVEFGRPVEILLVEDNPGDVRLTMEAFREARVRSRINTVPDGVEAMAFLHRDGSYLNAPCPDLVLLDLNLPKKDGRSVLAAIKADKNIQHIPVVVLTTSGDEQDIIKSYELQANCYVTKPVDLDQFLTKVRAIGDFWLDTVKLPRSD
jgi:two-component system, chemotaxis family, response regulator Rcp1